ncbi:MAG: BCCT family transporter [Phycisphaeraceae bacterium]
MTFVVSAGAILLFVLLGALLPAEVGAVTGSVQNWITTQFGWVYIVSVTIFLLFVLWLFISPYGHIKLGKDDDEPEYSKITWFAMLFSAGMGIGLLFYGVAEPVMHFDNPPRVQEGDVAAKVVQGARDQARPLMEEAQALRRAGSGAQADALDQEAEEIMAEVADEKVVATEAAKSAITTTYFHWGLHAWGIYILMGLALAYFAYRHDLPLTIRSTLYPLIGKRIHGPIGHAVEILAVFGTLFGLATSLGLGAMQINKGMQYLGMIPEQAAGEATAMIPILIIVAITLCATLSVVSGLNVGIRRLSELNLFLGIALMLFVFIAGPTVFLLSSYVQSIGNYLAALPEMTFRTDAFIGPDWQSGWTMFYWGWWISWSPFVGMFIARISRGRTIREFVMGVLLVPTLLTFAWITIFGNTALHMEVFGEGGMVEAVAESVDTSLFQMISQIAAPQLILTVATVLASIVIATYFITSSDSASLVVDILTTGGNPNPPVWTRVFWACSEGAVAAVLLWAGFNIGEPGQALGALQSAAIITGLPFCIILLIMCVSVVKGLRAEREAGVASVPYTPAHPTEHYSITPTQSDASDEREHSDWQNRLQQIIGKRKLPETAGELKEARNAIREFIDDTVAPAFADIKSELEKQGREVEIYVHETSATLIVRRGGDEEFRYAIRGRAFRRAAVAFPELDAPNTPRILRAEVVLRGGVAGEYELEEFTHHGIIEDFLNEYAKWMGW